MADVTVNFAIDFDHATFEEFVGGKGKLQIEPPGLILYRLLDEIYCGEPLRIVETGCLRDTSVNALMSDGWSTYYFAQWCEQHDQCMLAVMEIDPKNIQICRDFLAANALSAFVYFNEEESVAALEDMAMHDDWTNFYYLDSCDGLEHGLAEFKAALANDPQIIVMDDFDTKARLAYEFALANSIPVERVSRYTIFRPKT